MAAIVSSHEFMTLLLREMEHVGLVHREVYPIIPPKRAYALSNFGCTSLPVVQSMHEWGVSYEQECRYILAKCKA